MEKYPIDSKIIVAFVVDKNGRVIGKRIIKTITGTDLGEQLLEVVDDLEWQAGTCQGKAVSTLLVYPIILEIR